MTEQHDVDRANDFKADFDAVYNASDPCAYFRTLRELDYQIPQQAEAPIHQVLEDLGRVRGGDTPTVLDVGCSYGVNAALLKTDLDLDALYRHYAERPDDLPLDAARARDRVYFGEHRNADLSVVGLDVADRAVAYAEDVELLDHGIAANLEERELPEPAVPLVQDCDVVISTGAVGYVTSRTFAHLLDAVDGGPPPWVAAFVLRMFPYDEIQATLAAKGLETVRVTERTFRQRRFADDTEREQTLKLLDDAGLDPDGLESEGWFHAELYLSAPPHEIGRLSLLTGA